MLHFHRYFRDRLHTSAIIFFPGISGFHHNKLSHVTLIWNSSQRSNSSSTDEITFFPSSGLFYTNDGLYARFAATEPFIYAALRPFCNSLITFTSIEIELPLISWWAKQNALLSIIPYERRFVIEISWKRALQMEQKNRFGRTEINQCIWTRLFYSLSDE